MKHSKRTRTPLLIRRSDLPGLLLWVILAVLLSIGIWMVKPFLWWVVGIIAINVSTYLVMIVDKIQATQGAQRLSERSLYLMTLLGGSVGMVLAMYTVRHKNRKISFQLIVWTMIVLQLLAVFYFQYPSVRLDEIISSLSL